MNERIFFIFRPFSGDEFVNIGEYLVNEIRVALKTR